MWASLLLEKPIPCTEFFFIHKDMDKLAKIENAMRKDFENRFKGNMTNTLNSSNWSMANNMSLNNIADQLLISLED